MVAIPTGVLVACILDWIYKQAVQILEMLKAILLALIAAADAFILWLKAQLAILDVISQLEQAAWAVFQALVDAIRNQLLNFPEGPLAQLCPEFYQMFLDPALQYFDTTVAFITVYREKYKNVLSFMDEVEDLFAYWTQIKQELTDTVMILEDAILLAMAEAARKAAAGTP
jgi:hypothetical protein